MNTLIISSSLSKNSKSFILCNSVANNLNSKGVNCTIIDSRNIPLHHTHSPISIEMERLSMKIKEADNIIIGMGVHCYSLNDSLKTILDTSFVNAKNKFFGILCSAGGEKSYLSTMHLTQICMNEWRMIQLPRVVYATAKDFNNDAIKSVELTDRIKSFSNEFYSIGSKLLN